MIIPATFYALEVLGIFSACENYPELKNNFTRQSSKYNHVIALFYRYSRQLNYVGVDVCYNQTVLLDYLIGTILIYKKVGEHIDSF